MANETVRFETTIQKKVALDYLLHLPGSYDDDPQALWPLILFLHGMGERGEDPTLLEKHGPPKLIAAGKDLPFVVVSPQCPPTSVWANELEALRALLQSIIESKRVDRSRIYLTGLSMGGFGSWHLAAANPRAFAAVAPICGRAMSHAGFPGAIAAIKDVPVWAFHGAKDTVVPVEMSQVLVDVLDRVDGDVKFTVYPRASHDSWTRTYDDPGLFEWFLEHRNDRFAL